MDGTFTQKEMMIRMMEQLDNIEIKLNGTHELAKITNGKVKFHTKIICGLAGALIALATASIKFIFEVI